MTTIERRRFEGESIIVTGGGSGIGRAAAILFAKEGANVAIGDIAEAGGQATAKAITATGGRAFYVKTDVSKAAEAERLVKRTVEEFGSLHHLFNNAGIFSPLDLRVGDIDVAVFRRVIDVNLKGMYLVAKYALPHIVQSGGGAVILTGSSAAFSGGVGSAYETSKGGAVALMRSIALHYGPKGVRANAIVPGVVITPILNEIKAAYQTVPAPRETRKGNLLDRAAQPDEVARLVLFLCSEEAAYITGALLPVDGGKSAM